MTRPVALLAVLFVAVSWSAALATAPMSASPRVSALTYAAGSVICHQRTERSFHHAGAQYPVCARCLGLYAGAAGGVLLWASVSGLGVTPRARAAAIMRRSVIRRILIIVALPTMVTVAAAWLGWWDAGNVVRAASAFPLGVALAAVIAAVAAGDLR